MNQPHSSLSARLKKLGPAAIITSAFIGPGTVLTATIAGTNFGMALLWVVLLAVIALMILMEMSARIGIAGRSNVIDAAVEMFPGNKVWEYFVKGLIVTATGAICFAFQSGNISGASAGLSDLTGGLISIPVGAALIGAVAIATIFLSSFRALSRVMQFFVSFMAIVFVVTLVAVQPSVGEIAKGTFIPTLPENSLFNALGLVGTTLIGINLILHSITTGEKWAGKEGDEKHIEASVKDARFDILFNIIIGGLITFSIIIVAATTLHGTGTQIKSPAEFSLSLQPVLGDWARYIGDLGLFAAGLSSAIAIPFTFRAIMSKAFNTKDGINNTKLRVVAVIVVLFAVFILFNKISPLAIILVAQATSGLVLPIIAAILLVAANNQRIMRGFTNKPWQNIVGGLAVVLSFILGANGLLNVIKKLIALFVG